MIRNVNNHIVQLFKKVKLESIVKYIQSNCYNLISNANFLVTNNWISQRQQNRFWKIKLNMIVVVAIYIVSFEINVDISSINSLINSSINLFARFSSIITSSIITTFFVTIVDTSFENVLSNDIIVYDQTNVVNKLIVVIDSFSNIWNNQNTIVDISKNQ